MAIYIVAFLVCAILVVILFFALRSTVKRIDYNTKKYFVDKLQDYDYLIEEKQQILDKLNKEIEENKNKLSKNPNEEVKVIKEKRQNNYNNISTAKYIDKDLFKKYKDIKEKFNFNYRDILNDFVESKLCGINNDYEIALHIRESFTNEVIYKVMNLREKEQKKYINDLLDDNENKFIESFIDSSKFNIKKLLSKLDTFINKNDPIIYVYTGDKNVDYNDINKNIKTIYDENINEGIKIHYKGTLYDYSL